MTKTLWHMAKYCYILYLYRISSSHSIARQKLSHPLQSILQLLTHSIKEIIKNNIKIPKTITEVIYTLHTFLAYSQVSHVFLAIIARTSPIIYKGMLISIAIHTNINDCSINIKATKGMQIETTNKIIAIFARSLAFILFSLLSSIH